MDKETSEREVLLPCPFCGSSNIELRVSFGSWMISCECGADGPSVMASGYNEERTAKIEAWNRRAQPASTSEDTERLNWLDQHCAFVADPEYVIGPYMIGQLRQMADDGIKADKPKEKS